MNKGEKELKIIVKHLCEKDSFTVKKLWQILHNSIKAWKTKVYKAVISNRATFGPTLPAVCTSIYDLALTINMFCNICNNSSLRCLKSFYQHPVR